MQTEDEQAILCNRGERYSPPDGYRYLKDSSDGNPLFVLDEKKQNSYPSKIINQALTGSKGVTAVLVKEEQAVEQISLARYYQEPTPKINNEIIHSYPPNNRVLRIEYPTTDPKRLAAGKNYEKTCLYQHFNGIEWVKGEDKKSPLEAYRYSEQKKALNWGEYLLLPEGETNVEAFNEVGLAAVTFRKYNAIENTELLEYSKKLNLTWVLIQDNDVLKHKNSKYTTAEQHTQQIQKTCNQHNIDSIVLTIVDILAIAKTLHLSIPPNWEETPPEGADIKDLIDYWKSTNNEVNNTMSEQINPVVQERLVRLLTEAIRQKRAEMALSQVKAEQSQKKEEKPPKSNINLIVEQELFAGHWISVNDKLYEYVGTYYEERDIKVQKRKIAHFLKSQEVTVGGVVTYPYAKTSYVEECFKWVMLNFAVPSGQLNPPGINCTNTILRINWVGNIPSFEQIPHSPEQYYTYPPSFPYQSEADTTDCNKLLSALDPEQREILLRTIAASLDLPHVRKYKGRLVKSLICHGDGSNGKDTIRELVALLHGEGLTAVTLSDFGAYDKGRKFPLSRLEQSHCNWASENIQHGKLDHCQSLKAAITGDKLSAEPKGVNEKEFNPKAVFIFNCNELPPIGGNSEAFLSRYTILKFTKTYKLNANIAAGELEADPRYKYDPDFLKTKVMPAFVNIILDQLVKLMLDGVDYTCTTVAMEEARSDNNHLYQACRDIGLVAAKGSEILLKDVSESLDNWYKDNGYFEEVSDKNGKVKKIWITDVDKSDPLVKAPKDLCTRLKTVFGSSLKTRVGHGRATYLVGVKFQTIEEQAHLIHQNEPEVSPANDYTPQSFDSPVASPEQYLLHQEELESLQNNDSSILPLVQNSTSPQSNLLHQEDPKPITPVENVQLPVVENSINDDCNDKSASSVQQTTDQIQTLVDTYPLAVGDMVITPMGNQGEIVKITLDPKIPEFLGDAKIKLPDGQISNWPVRQLKKIT